MNVRELIDSVPNWYHRFEFAPGLVTPGLNDSQTALALLQLPNDLSGLRVLDIGARDGFFSFECERRGAADVVSIDYVPAEMLQKNKFACTATRSSGERGTFVAVRTSSNKDYYLVIARNLVGGPNGWLKIPEEPKAE